MPVRRNSKIAIAQDALFVFKGLFVNIVRMITMSLIELLEQLISRLEKTSLGLTQQHRRQALRRGTGRSIQFQQDIKKFKPHRGS